MNDIEDPKRIDEMFENLPPISPPTLEGVDAIRDATFVNDRLVGETKDGTVLFARDASEVRTILLRALDEANEKLEENNLYIFSQTSLKKADDLAVENAQLKARGEELEKDIKDAFGESHNSKVEWILSKYVKD